MGPFWAPFFCVFNGRLKYDHFGGSVGHGICLWFPITGGIACCRFLRPRRAIEMIEMIEMIEVIWGGAAGRGCAFRVAPVGIELELS